MSIEERMSKCIVYNLTILGYAVKPTEQAEEFITDGLFLKTNTNAFIHVTHYLFNIIDTKEFKKKFYWPISDKKSENSYRTNSVEFINSIIDRFSLQQEKIKHVTVVHPSGKKFMSLMIDIIGVAIKEVMKRRKYSLESSLDIEKAEGVISTLSKIENEIVGNVKTELKTIRERTVEIQELINSIYPSDENSVPFEDFIENWHALNATRLEKLREKNAKVKEVFRKSNLLHEKAQKMFSNKKYEIVQPSDSEIKELADFYQQLDLPVEKQLNIVTLILYLQSTLSIIQNYIKNFSYDEVEISEEEMRVVKRKLEELRNFEPLIKKLNEKEVELKEKIKKVHAEREEVSIEQDNLDESEKLAKEAQGKETLRALLSPRYNFDASRSSKNCVNIKANHLIFAENDGASSVDHTMMSLNQSRLYRPLSDTTLNRSNSRDMGPPKASSKPPSRRRRRDPMELLEKATTSTNRNRPDMNSTVNYAGTAPKMVASTPFSSTLLSPDLIHHANFSMISNISSITTTPHIGNFHRAAPEAGRKELYNIPKPDVLSSDQNEDTILWSDHQTFNIVQKEEVFDSRKPLHALEVDNLQNSSPVVPKMQLNDETLRYMGSESLSVTEPTVCEKENFGSEVDTILCAKSPGDDENLFNISDPVLVEND